MPHGSTRRHRAAEAKGEAEGKSQPCDTDECDPQSAFANNGSGGDIRVYYKRDPTVVGAAQNALLRCSGNSEPGRPGGFCDEQVDGKEVCFQWGLSAGKRGEKRKDDRDGENLRVQEVRQSAVCRGGVFYQRANVNRVRYFDGH